MRRLVNQRGRRTDLISRLAKPLGPIENFHGTVRMLDADCQETTGKTLTFFKASDRVLVDGNEEIRTQTKGGGKCPQPPSN